jgi:hypothetical protein
LFFSAEYLIVMGKKKTVEVAVSVPVKAEKKKSGRRVLEEAVVAPPPKKSKAEKKVVPSPRIEESSEDLDEEECG